MVAKAAVVGPWEEQSCNMTTSMLVTLDTWLGVVPQDQGQLEAKALGHEAAEPPKSVVSVPLVPFQQSSQDGL